MQTVPAWETHFVIRSNSRNSVSWSTRLLVVRTILSGPAADEGEILRRILVLCYDFEPYVQCAASGSSQRYSTGKQAYGKRESDYRVCEFGQEVQRWRNLSIANAFDRWQHKYRPVSSMLIRDTDIAILFCMSVRRSVCLSVTFQYCIQNGWTHHHYFLHRMVAQSF